MHLEKAIIGINPFDDGSGYEYTVEMNSAGDITVRGNTSDGVFAEIDAWEQIQTAITTLNELRNNVLAQV